MPMSTCGGCGKIFSSLSLFDAHRIGNYGEAIRGATNRSLIYKPSDRRCMTTDELKGAGYKFEAKEITILREGQPHREKRDIWYDPVAREKMREAFRKGEQEEADED